MASRSEDERNDALVSVCRTAIGDRLRSVTYFTADDYEQLYLREDLTVGADLAQFVANERLGFTSQDTYGDTELGEYLFTIRVFDQGYLTRTIVGDHGVFVTTGPLHMDEFREIETSVRAVLEGSEG